MALTLGTRLGPYEILSAIGAGGMGEVYKARDARLERTVAIKVLPETLAADPQFRERFDREARAISQLTHPHICTLYDVGEHAPSTGSGHAVAYLVMELLEGETLEQRLKKGALPLEQALKTAIEIASALDKAHRAGITHRDLKPGNIMLTKSGAKLLDFGLAKSSSPVVAGANLSMLPTTPPNLTAQGTILGTFQYMAPEQLEGQEADPRTDIFAFGAVLYEMLTGKKTFEGKSQASLIGAIMHADPPPVSTLQPITPPRLDRVLKKSLAKDPDARYQSAHDLCDELRWIAETPGSAPTTARPRALTRERVGWALLAIGALTIGVIATAVIRPMRSATPESPTVRFDIVPPGTRNNGDYYGFALSPDGRQLVFAATTDHLQRLWLRPLDRTTAQMIPGTEGAVKPFWSPDGRSLAFVTDGKLKRIDVSGGPARILCDGAISGGAWNRDGIIIFARVLGPLGRVSAAGGPCVDATRLAAGQTAHRWPQFLPDGHRFTFREQRGNFGNAPGAVYVGSLDGDEPRLILDTADSGAVPDPAGSLLVGQQGALVSRPFDPVRAIVRGDPVTVASVAQTPSGMPGFSVSETGVLAYQAGSVLAAKSQLVWVDRVGKVLGSIGKPSETTPSDIQLSVDGRYVTGARSGGVWLLDLTRGVETRFTSGPAQFAVWSRDGRRIAFRSVRGDVGQLFQAALEGGTVEQSLFDTPETKTPLDWSPDGSVLVYQVYDPKTGFDIWALPLVGERKPFAVLQTMANEGGAQFSPDGKWLAYQSNESGVAEIYVQAFPTAGRRWQVSSGGGTRPRWRPDGNELFYLASNLRLMAVSMTVGRDEHTLESGAPVALFATQVVWTTSLGMPKPNYAVAPDGQRFLMNVVTDESGPSPITVVLNWTAGLKK